MMGRKHKWVNENPIIQVSPIEYFSNDREEMPTWLKSHKKGDKIDFSKLLASRIVYYPGSALEGSPIRIFNTAHAAHVYLYIDYGFEKEEIKKLMSETFPAGYHIYDETEVGAADIIPRALRYHLTADEQRMVMERYQEKYVPTHNSFGFLKIYERDESYGEEHGAQRFALLYISGDAIATYDAIFGNTNAKPFACITGNYGFGGAYESFSKDSLLETIAIRIDRLPKYLLSDICDGWNNYQMLKTVGGTNYRFVWVRDEYGQSINKFLENLYVNFVDDFEEE